MVEAADNPESNNSKGLILFVLDHICCLSWQTLFEFDTKLQLYSVFLSVFTKRLWIVFGVVEGRENRVFSGASYISLTLCQPEWHELRDADWVIPAEMKRPKLPLVSGVSDREGPCWSHVVCILLFLPSIWEHCNHYLGIKYRKQGWRREILCTLRTCFPYIVHWVINIPLLLYFAVSEFPMNQMKI